MAVHRIDERAELFLQRIARQENKKPSEVLSELVKDYYRGLLFDDTESDSVCVESEGVE